MNDDDSIDDVAETFSTLMKKQNNKETNDSDDTTESECREPTNQESGNGKNHQHQTEPPEVGENETGKGASPDLLFHAVWGFCVLLSGLCRLAKSTIG